MIDRLEEGQRVRIAPPSRTDDPAVTRPLPSRPPRATAMPLIRFALRNPYAVIALAVGLSLLGAAVLPGVTIDILPDFKRPVVVSFFSYPGLPTARHGEERHLPGRAGS